MKLSVKSFGVGILVYIALAVGVLGQTSNSYRLDDLLKNMTDQESWRVLRNEKGEVVSILLGGAGGGEFLEETNITLLTNLNSLTTVRLQASHGHILTPKAVALLSALPNLTNLSLGCFWDKLEPGVFTEVCKITKLKSLALAGVSPAHDEFNAITNLQDLTYFNALVSSTIGKQELSLLTTLPRLSSLKIEATMVTRDETNILKSCLSLTNFEFGDAIRRGNDGATNALPFDVKSP